MEGNTRESADDFTMTDRQTERRNSYVSRGGIRDSLIAVQSEDVMWEDLLKTMEYELGE